MSEQDDIVKPGQGRSVQSLKDSAILFFAMCGIGAVLALFVASGLVGAGCATTSGAGNDLQHAGGR